MNTPIFDRTVHDLAIRQHQVAAFLPLTRGNRAAPTGVVCTCGAQVMSDCAGRALGWHQRSERERLRRVVVGETETTERYV